MPRSAQRRSLAEQGARILTPILAVGSSETNRGTGAARHMPFTVTVRHDEAAHIWYVHESDVPGLHAEAATLDELVGVIEALSPDLIAANLPSDETGDRPDIPVCVQHLVSAKRVRAA